jgi:recombination protein RecR
MSYRGPQAFRRAVTELARLPGIGEKSAQRLALFLVRSEGKYVQELAEALADLTRKITLCRTCFGLADTEECGICRDPARDDGLICVVEEPSDLMAVEQSGQYRGRYHVLHGSLAPLDGVGPEHLKVRELLERVKGRPVREVVLATNPDVEGEATALYVAKLLGEQGIRSSRIAMGIPMGGHLEYADQVTLARAIAERREFTVR